MDCKCGLIFVFLLVVSVSFVSSAAYPEPFDNDGAFVINVHDDGKFQEEKDCNGKGCFRDDYCYPKEYRLGEEYCDKDPYYYDEYGIEVYKFLNQSQTGSYCGNDYECLSNVCSEEICINRTEEINRQVNAKVEEIKQNITNKIDENLDELNKDENVSVTEKSIIEKFLNWIKDIFS